jgi:hypothetical protein
MAGHLSIFWIESGNDMIAASVMDGSQNPDSDSVQIASNVRTYRFQELFGTWHTS